MSEGSDFELLKSWWTAVAAAAGAAIGWLTSRFGNGHGPEADKIVAAIARLEQAVRDENGATRAALHGRFNQVETELDAVKSALADARREGAEREARMTFARTTR